MEIPVRRYPHRRAFGDKKTIIDSHFDTNGRRRAGKPTEFGKKILDLEKDYIKAFRELPEHIKRIINTNDMIVEIGDLSIKGFPPYPFVSPSDNKIRIPVVQNGSLIKEGAYFGVVTHEAGHAKDRALFRIFKISDGPETFFWTSDHQLFVNADERDMKNIPNSEKHWTMGTWGYFLPATKGGVHADANKARQETFAQAALFGHDSKSLAAANKWYSAFYQVPDIYTRTFKAHHPHMLAVTQKFDRELARISRENPLDLVKDPKETRFKAALKAYLQKLPGDPDVFLSINADGSVDRLGKEKVGELKQLPPLKYPVIGSKSWINSGEHKQLMKEAGQELPERRPPSNAPRQ